jgi:hypothetical protein
MRKGLATATLLVPWLIWKHRNSCVFDGEQPSIQSVNDKIKAEADFGLELEPLAFAPCYL